ncbi:MAG TPA: diguanylate cyclase [Myxococcota bacterium]|nr:diguanylate cyclase [Myxococcota bacterium]HQK50255.1 diguanylate cyclase [Myxococcota bacterium]
MRVLVVDDDRLTRRMLERYLTDLGYEVIAAQDGAEALRILETRRVPIVLTDWEMPGISGLELVRRIREDPEAPFRYLIFLTVRESREDLVRGIEAGADDYIRKPFDRSELAVRVRAGERIVRLQERLERLADTDPLTDTLNRRGLERWLREQEEDRMREGQRMAFVMVDLDHFKSINDLFGHATGDRFLCQAARCLVDHFPPGSRVARMGGEEFLAIFPVARVEEALQAAERVRAALPAMPVFPTRDGAPVHLKASLGVAILEGPLDADAFDRLLRRADAALYRSKDLGRNRVTLWEPGMIPHEGS